MTRPIISPDEAPTSLNGAWSLFPLYKQPARGGLRMWQVEFDGVDHLEIHYGVVGGAIQLDRTEVKLNNSKRNMQEQAFLEARSRYLKKFREGYEPVQESTLPRAEGEDQVIEAKTPTHTKVMEAAKYREGMIKHWPVITQPKLDGIRMTASLENGVLRFRSRGNKFFTTLAHLSNDVMKLLSLLPAGAKLDGELYSPNIASFQELCSVLKRAKKPHKRLPEIEYWIFDVNLLPSPEGVGQPFEVRYNILAQVMGYPLIGETTPVKNPYSTLRLVHSQLAFSHEEIMQQHKLYVSQGYEGIMIRKTAYNLTPEDPLYAQALYRNGRSQNMLKHKDFEDEEFEIIGIQEAEGNQKGAVVFEVQDADGNKFTCGMEGPLAQRRELFQHPELVIGKKLTIRFQELTNKGVPRFPVGVAIRDYE